MEKGNFTKDKQMNDLQQRIIEAILSADLSDAGIARVKIDHPNCAAPFLTETTIDGYDESVVAILGTGFIVSHGGFLWAITAKHNVKSLNPNDLIIPQCIPCKRFYESEYLITTRSPESEDDTDYCDLAIIKLTNDINAAPCCPKCITPPAFTETTVSANQRVFVQGFPHDVSTSNTVEFAPLKVVSQLATINGFMVGRASSQHCFLIKLFNEHEFSHYSGMSGSPVFTSSREPALIGMLIRGHNPDANQTFLSASIIRESVNRALRDEHDGEKQ